MQSAIEDTIERIRHQDGVQGFFIVDDEGILLRCKNLDKEYALEIASEIKGLVGNARHCVRDIDPTVSYKPLSHNPESKKEEGNK